MRLDPKKIVFNKPMSLSQAIKAYSILDEVIDATQLGDDYIYVHIKEGFSFNVETIEKNEVDWLSKELGVTDREAVICIIEYPGYLEDLKDHLYNCRINGYKRYSVFTKADIMGDWDQTWEEYIGVSEDDARFFFKNILKVDGIVSILEMDDEEEDF